MEAFCIAVAKRLHLPGFGDRAITDPQGNAFPLNRAEDFYLRVAANIAFMGKTPVAPANQEDITLTGVSRILPAIQHTLKADEVGRVAFIYSRGGRFAPEDSGYTEQRLGNAWKNPYRSGMQMSPPTVTPSPGSASAVARSGIRRVCQMVVRLTTSFPLGNGR